MCELSNKVDSEMEISKSIRFYFLALTELLFCAFNR